MNLKMKSVFIFSFAVILALLFSCKSTPKIEDVPLPIEEPEEAEGAIIIEESELAEGFLAEVEDDDDSTGQELATEPEPVIAEEVTEPEPEIAQEPVDGEGAAGETTGTPEVTAVTEPAPERRPPPVPPPALLGPAEERRPVVRTAPSTQTPSAQTPSTLAPPSLIVQTPSQTAQTSPPETEAASPRADSQSSSPTVSAIRDNPPFPARSGVLLAPDDKIEFSRIVRATVGQIIEIPFRGNGWVFLGELKSQRGIEFIPPTRRDSEGQTFIFRAEETGTYALKFFRQDFLRDYILNDYVQVIVEEDPISGTARYNAPTDRGRVTALPRWPSALDEANIIRGGSGSRTAPDSSGAGEPLAYVETAPRPARGTPAQPPVQGDAAPSRPSSSLTAPSSSAPTPTATTPTPAPQSTAPQTEQPTTAQGTAAESDVPQSDALQSEERLPLDDALQKAKEIFDGGNIASAIAMLDRYREYYPSGSDELYWLLGQFYEAAGPTRDILLSLDYYRRLVNEYPQSSRFIDARRRIAYLERFYINIQ